MFLSICKINFYRDFGKEEEMKKKNIIISAIFLLFLSSCMTKKTNSKSTQTSNTTYGDPYNNSGNSNTGGSNTGGTTGGTTSDGTGYGSGTEAGTPDAGQTIDYITIEDIVLRGTRTNSVYNNYPNGSPYWTSAQVGSSDQGMFHTDSRFNVRVRAQATPAKDAVDAFGRKCTLYNSYKKVNVDICIRTQAGSCINTHSFTNIPINQVSKVKEFSINSASSLPLVVEVRGFQTDGACQAYLSQYPGSTESDPNYTSYCPMGLVNPTACVKFDIQFSTDYTKDFPASAPRY